jgi:protocatechuate 3,4-dioxygenase beta subunit
MNTANPNQEKLPYFVEETSEAVVNSRMGEDVDPRLKQVMAAIVKHLHAAVKEIEPTHEEWLAAIRFLTSTGQMCNEWRQEYILLSDILGVSMLVDSINHRRPSGATPNTILGPFYVENAPEYELGHNICLDKKGEPMVVRGQVRDIAGRMIEGARIDVWQTNDDGFYDVQQPGVQPEANLRGVFASDAAGKYWFKSVKPRFYPIPSDGPVGKLLLEMGRHPNRAAHLHFIVSAPGYETVITHIFTPDCPYLKEDAVFGVKQDLVADFKKIDSPVEAEAVGLAEPFWLVDWDFVLAPGKA